MVCVICDLLKHPVCVPAQHPARPALIERAALPKLQILLCCSHLLPWLAVWTSLSLKCHWTSGVHRVHAVATSDTCTA